MRSHTAAVLVRVAVSVVAALGLLCGYALQQPDSRLAGKLLSRETRAHRLIACLRRAYNAPRIVRIVQSGRRPGPAFSTAMDVTYTGDGRIVVTTRSGGYMQMEEYAPGRRTARALAETGDAAVPRLIECLGHDSYWGLRAYAAGVLGDYGERAVPAVPALIDCIEDEVLTLRGPAVSALVRIGDPAVLPLVGCLADEHSSVRDAAEEALVRIGGPEVVRALTEALTSEGPRLREAAEHALERIRAAGG